MAATRVPEAPFLISAFLNVDNWRTHSFCKRVSSFDEVYSATDLSIAGRPAWLDSGPY